MLEDISHLLNNGEIPELFLTEEKARIVEEMDNNLKGVHSDDDMLTTANKTGF